MSDLNIAIFGSSGSIGNALSIEYAENNKVNKMHLILVSYLFRIKYFNHKLITKLINN